MTFRIFLRWIERAAAGETVAWLAGALLLLTPSAGLANSPTLSTAAGSTAACGTPDAVCVPGADV